MNENDAPEVHVLQHRLFTVPYAWPLEYLIALGKVHGGLIGRVGDRLVGFALFENRPKEPSNPEDLSNLNREDWVLTVTCVGTDPEFRNQGIATALMGQVVKLAPGKPWYLEVKASNTPAIHVYTKVGFVEEARLPGYYVDTHEDGLYMRYNPK